MVCKKSTPGQPPPHPPAPPPKKNSKKLSGLSLHILKRVFTAVKRVAYEQQTHFRSSLLSLQKIEGEATTGNASVVRRLLKEMQSSKFGNVKWVPSVKHLVVCLVLNKY